MDWVYSELVLVSLAAMLSPTTLTFTVFALVLGSRPLRTGVWFYLGALGVTLLIGGAAAIVLGDTAASRTPSSPKTWVAVLDLVLGAAVLAWVWHVRRRKIDPAKTEATIAKMSKVASSPAIAIVAAGATLANPGMFIPIALKAISETNPTAAGYAVQWVAFSVVSLLPLLVAIVLLLVAEHWALRVLVGARGWLERHAITVALVIVSVLALSLLRSGISGIVS